MKTILKKDIKRGVKFYWNTFGEFGGLYEVICFTKDLQKILCYKPKGRKATINEESLAKFDERIIRNPEFLLMEG